MLFSLFFFFLQINIKIILEKDIYNLFVPFEGVQAKSSKINPIIHTHCYRSISKFYYTVFHLWSYNVAKIIKNRSNLCSYFTDHFQNPIRTDMFVRLQCPCNN